MNTYGVWYNADAMTKAGLPIPKAGWTYDEMLKDAAALTTKSGSTTNYGLVNSPTDPFAIGDCSVSSGGAPFADKINNATKVTIDDKYMACAQKYIDAIKAGSINPPEANPTGDDATNGFIAGKIPMLYFGQWLAPSFAKAKIGFKYGFAPLPVSGSVVAQPYDAVGIISPTTIKSS